MPLTRPRFNQFDTTISSISDPITVLNKTSTLANIDIGFILNRDGGTSSNVALFWQESANTFVLAFSSNTGEITQSVTNSNIAVSSYANLRINTLTSGNIIATGNVVAPYFFGNGSQLSGIITSVVKIISGNSDITTYENSNIAVSVGGTANTVVFTSSNTFISGSLIPTANLIYDLGSPTNRFRSAYFGGNSVYVGEEAIHVAPDGTWTFTSDGHNINLGINHEFNPPSANISGNVIARYFYGNGSQLTNINSFSNIFVSGQNPIQADSMTDTLTLAGGTGIAITANAITDTITISQAVSTFASDADFGSVAETATLTEDEGLVTDSVTLSYDLGSIVISGPIYPDTLVLPSYTVTTLPSASPTAQIIYVSNESGGAVVAFSDGTNWRRLTDRAIVS